jgi:hypothetical protein
MSIDTYASARNGKIEILCGKKCEGDSDVQSYVVDGNTLTLREESGDTYRYRKFRGRHCRHRP